MWVFSKYGLYSIVKGIGDTWQIRARKLEDLINLMAASGIEYEIRDNIGQDYAYRVFVEAADLSRVMETFQEALDYTNFKNTVAALPDQRDKMPILGRLWQEMFDYQERAQAKKHRGKPRCRSRKELSSV